MLDRSDTPVAPSPTPESTSSLAKGLGTTSAFAPYKAKQSSDPTELMNLKSEASNELGQAEAEQAKETSIADADLAKGKADVAGDYAKNLRSITDAAKAKIDQTEQPHPPPTKDNAKDFTAMFSLMTVLSAMSGGSGKHSALAGMHSMAAAMKGYKQGRDDLYQKEMKNFDKNVLAYKDHVASIRQDLSDYQKLAATDKDAAEAKLMDARLKAGADSIAAYAFRTGNIREVMKQYDVAYNNAVKLQTQAEKLKTDAWHEKMASGQLDVARGNLAVHQDLAEIARNREVDAKNARSEKKNTEDDLKEFFESNGIHIAHKEERQKVSAAISSVKELTALQDKVRKDSSLVGRPGQVNKAVQQYLKSWKSENPDDSGFSDSENDQKALLFAKEFASMRTRYERVLGGSRQAQAFRAQYDKLLNSDQFNQAGLIALIDSMKAEAAREASTASPKITPELFNKMSGSYGVIENPRGKEHSRPTGMSDEDWAAYKKAVGG